MIHYAIKGAKSITLFAADRDFIDALTYVMDKTDIKVMGFKANTS